MDDKILEEFQFAVTTKNKTSNLTNQIALNSKDLHKLVKAAIKQARIEALREIQQKINSFTEYEVMSLNKGVLIPAVNKRSIKRVLDNLINQISST